MKITNKFWFEIRADADLLNLPKGWNKRIFLASSAIEFSYKFKYDEEMSLETTLRGLDGQKYSISNLDDIDWMKHKTKFK